METLAYYKSESPDKYSVLDGSFELVNILENFQFENEGSEPVWLCTFDVSAMYTNIDIVEGLTIMKELLSDTGMSSTKVEAFIRLWEFVLTNNYFQFDGKLFKQIRGTAMGTNGAPPFANLFMLYYELKYIYNSNSQISNVFICENIKFYKRFLDDSLLFWIGSRNDLDRFIDSINTWSSSIKVEAVCSNSSVPYLDLRIGYNSGSKVFVQLYDKPMNAHCYTSPLSEYPDSYKYGWIYGETIRICRNSSHEEDFKEAVKAFTTHLKARKYPESVIVKHTARVSHNNRKTLLAHVAKERERLRVYFKNTKTRTLLTKTLTKVVKEIESLTGLTLAIQKVVYKGKNISTFTRRVNRQILASKRKNWKRLIYLNK
jgi:hypothetical protein